MEKKNQRSGDDSTDRLLTGLIQTATLTNRELFTAVIAAIKRGGSKTQQQKSEKKKNDVSWQHVAMKVAISAAKGIDGYACIDEWVSRYNELIISIGDGSRADNTATKTTTTPTNFGEAIKSLSARDCHRNRLRNALDAISVSGAVLSSLKLNLSIHEVAGLIRGSSFLSTIAVDDAVERSKDEDDFALQTRAIAHLVHSMTISSSTLLFNPFDIFLAVQLPLLQKLNRDALDLGGLTFTTDEARAGFQNLLDLNFDAESYTSGRKRGRASEEEEDYDVKKDVLPDSVHHLFLEAAHLARNGAVRAQHGAVIYTRISSLKGCDDYSHGKVKIIGRGWNHDYLLDPNYSNKNKIVLHSEVHAVADAIARFGENECFETLFPSATIVIVELHSDYAYETCHPCPKCDPLLRAVGIGHVLHSTPHGKLVELDFTPQLLRCSNSASLLSNENVYIPLSAACRERGICCNRLSMSPSNSN